MANTLRSVFLGLLLLLIGLQVRFWVGDGGIMEYRRLKNDLAEDRRDLQLLKDRNQMLEAEVQDLKHHLSAIEERARTDMGMIRRGETLYQNVQ